MKVVINARHGGFCLSRKAYEFLGLEWSALGQKYSVNTRRNRTSKKLIRCIEKLGSERASGRYARLVIIEVPDGVKWHITEYDGLEEIHENHRSWRAK